MTDAERLARAVLLFHSESPWTPEKQATWRQLTGEPECTTVKLCNLARKILDEYMATLSSRDILQRALEEFANPANWHDSIAGCRWIAPGNNPLDIARVALQVIEVTGGKP